MLHLTKILFKLFPHLLILKLCILVITLLFSVLAKNVRLSSLGHLKWMEILIFKTEQNKILRNIYDFG